MRQGFYGVFKGRKKDVKRMDSGKKVEMPSAFGRLSLVRYAHNVAVTIPARFAARGRSKYTVVLR